MFAKHIKYNLFKTKFLASGLRTPNLNLEYVNKINPNILQTLQQKVYIPPIVEKKKDKSIKNKKQPIQLKKQKLRYLLIKNIISYF